MGSHDCQSRTVWTGPHPAISGTASMEHDSTHFLVRTCVDRLAGDGHPTISKIMQQIQIKGPRRELRDAKGRPFTTLQSPLWC